MMCHPVLRNGCCRQRGRQGCWSAAVCCCGWQPILMVIVLLLGSATAAATDVETGNDVTEGQIESSPAIESSGAETQEADSARELAGRNVCQFDPDRGPEMVIIPPGRFVMGSATENELADDNEKPEHEVDIRYTFALSRCEITVADFRAFVESVNFTTDVEKRDAETQTGCFGPDQDGNWNRVDGSHWNKPPFPEDFLQSEKHPAVCVSYNDALAYIDWLNETLRLPVDACKRKDAKPDEAEPSQEGGVFQSVAECYAYRLSTEAEFEYALNARIRQNYPWGDDSQCDHANGADAKLRDDASQSDLRYAECNDGQAYTAAVGSFSPNRFGLYDLSGNTWEWTQDCWNGSYNGAPLDGSAWLDGDCDLRVLRGGGWSYKPDGLRSANRNGLNRDVGNINVGFRLARTLRPVSSDL